MEIFGFIIALLPLLIPLLSMLSKVQISDTAETSKLNADDKILGDRLESRIDEVWGTR